MFYILTKHGDGSLNLYGYTDHTLWDITRFAEQYHPLKEESLILPFYTLSEDSLFIIYTPLELMSIFKLNKKGEVSLELISTLTKDDIDFSIIEGTVHSVMSNNYKDYILVVDEKNFYRYYF